MHRDENRTLDVDDLVHCLMPPHGGDLEMLGDVLDIGVRERNLFQIETGAERLARAEARSNMTMLQ